MNQNNNKQIINLSITDILSIAERNPNGTAITSEVKEYLDENGNTVREFKLLAR